MRLLFLKTYLQNFIIAMLFYLENIQTYVRIQVPLHTHGTNPFMKASFIESLISHA